MGSSLLVFRFALVGCALAAVTACGGPQPPSAAPGLLPPANGVESSGLRVYVPNYATASVSTYNGRGTQIKPTINLGFPFAVAVDRNGKIYVTSDYKGAVGTFRPDGRRTTPTIKGITNPQGIAVDANLKIYVVNGSVTSGGFGSVTTYKPDGTPTTPTISGIVDPEGVAVDSRGYIYVTSHDDYPTGSVNVYGPDGSRFGAIKHNITSPLGIAIDANDKIYVANIGYAYAIGSGSGYVTTYKPDLRATKPTITTNIDNPFGVAVDAHGKIFVTNDGSGSTFGNVTSYLPDGTETAPTISTGIRQPYFLAVRSL